MITDQAELLYRKIKENNMSLEECIQLMKDLKGQNEETESIIFKRTLHDLTAWASDILKVEQKDIDVFTEITDYGFDQILITEFINKLNQKYMLDINSKIMFEQKNIHSLATYLIQQHTETLAGLYGVEIFTDQIKGENKFDIGEEVFREKVIGYFKKSLSFVIKIPETQIEEDAFFEEYGIDSIMVMKLTGELEKDFGSLPKTLFFEYQNLQTLAGYFIEQYPEQLPKILGIEENQTAPQKGMGKSVKPVPQRNRLIHMQTGGRNPRNRSALRVQEARRENEGMDIAVIGVAGRYPQARTMEEFWQNLKSGKDCITEIPQERWDHRLYYDEDKNKIGKTYSKWGGFIEGVDQFDPLFFHITPREAEIMDPQERLFLQCVYEALEDAGYTRDSLGKNEAFGLKGNVGVYVGVINEEYQLYGAQEQIKGNHIVLSGTLSSIANRVSYFCNFHGPSMAVDTMCSSSLTAIHLACQGLRSGGCEVAIAGGVNVSIHPNKYLMLGQGKFASSKGKCESFGEGGDGYVPGEGVGAVLLKPLDKAIEDGDQIYGIIKATAVNHGGKTNGYTVPNPNAQASILSRAYKESGINPRTISYIEAHGTGTALGDPIEIAGLNKSFREYTKGNQFCVIGSVKSNIGHCESAAGIAGLTKVLLQLKYRQLVPSLHSKALNPNIDFENSPFVVQQELKGWERPIVEIDGRSKEYPRVAGISSFGAGGSNAHILVAEYIPEKAEIQQEPVSDSSPAVIVISAKNEEQLKEKAKQLLDAIEGRGFRETDVFNLAYTLQVGREAMEERAGFIAGSLEEVKEKLSKLIEGHDEVEGVYRGQQKRNKETITDLFSDEELQEAMDEWLLQKKYSRILGLWVKGGQVEWSKLYEVQKARRISLPTYPFARERYWVPMGEGKSAVILGTNPVQVDELHPLLHENISDLREVKYRSRFTGEEFYLSDHVIKGKRILPGAAYLEMAREAAVRGACLSGTEAVVHIKNVMWAAPVVVAEAAVEIHTRLNLQDNGEIQYEIYSPNEGNEEVTVHSEGSILVYTAEDTPVLDIEALIESCHQKELASKQCYEGFITMGMEYGPAHKGIERIYVGQGQAIAKLRLPDAIADTEEQFKLHPALIDSALQATLGVWAASDPAKPALPFALEDLRVIRGCSREMWCFVRYSAGSRAGDKVEKLDIDLCDSQGKICVQMRGFSSRVMEGEELGTAILRPYWREQAADGPAEGAAKAEHLVVLCEGDSRLESYIRKEMKVRCLLLEEAYDSNGERFDSSAARVFEEVQQLFKERHKERILVQVVVPSERLQLFEALSGLLKTAQLEHPGFTGQLIEMDGEEEGPSIVKKLEENAGCPMDDRIRYRDGNRWVMDWEEVQENGEEGHIPWKDRGVYWITGGLGGLGLIFAGEIVERVTEAVLILTGRSPLTEEKEAKLKQLEVRGARVAYRQVDVSCKEAVEELVVWIQEEFGGLNGIIHSAGVIRDNYILRKTTEEWKEVLNPKVAGVRNLDEATKGEKLDFVILFSSGAGVIGNPGQADYATANGFMDVYAGYRNKLAAAGQRSGHTLSINWPLWKQGGMQVDEEIEAMMRQDTGAVALETPQGIEAFYRGFASGQDQVMVVAGRLEKLYKVWEGRKRTARQEEVKPGLEKGELLERVIGYVKKSLSTVIKLPAGQIDEHAPLEKYGIDSIMVMQLTRVLEKDFGSLPKTLFFEYQNLQTLAGYFIEQYPEQLPKILGIEENQTAPQKGMGKSVKPVPQRNRLIHMQTDGRNPRNGSALRVQEARRENEGMDIAVIGVAGRYPQARTMEEFWQNLKSGKDCITEIPQERWDHRLYYDEDKNKIGKTYSKWGGFIEGVDQFDPLFFHITPREAEIMDPQERLFLQCVYEALEDAGYTRESLGKHEAFGLKGNVGVYVGVMYEEYQLYGAQEQVRGNNVALSGNPSSIANRVSYFCNFHGPSMAVDTMCSSSLTAIHLACQGLRSGGCEVAIAGGVNVSIHPNKYLMLGQGKFASSKGKCESFGEGGDGYVPGEGVGAVLLKPLDKAIEDGDQIYGIIKATAVNHGGKTNGYTVPNPNAQASILSRAYKESGINPRTISYIEAHGTGTALGDPIEIAGLNKSFREYTKGNQFCVIGSVKSNIGHCESAAGIAGLTKVLLQLKYRQLVPSLHSKALNPNIDFENSPFVVQQELKGWERPIVEIDGRSKEYPRVAGISSFGAGGSNAHILVAEYIPEKAEIQQEPVSDSSPAVIVISAKNEEQLNEKAKQLLDAIEGRGFRETDVFNLAYTLQVGREAMEERAGFIAESLEEVKEKLSKLIEGHDEAEGVYRGQQKRNKETITDLFSDEELQEVMDKWLLQKKYSRILGLWVKGGQVEWSKLYGVQKARRISLPTYPFARERYWITNIVGGGTIPFDKKPDEVERKQINKKTCFVEKGWEKSNITKVKANINGKIIILANQETMKLAEEVSKQLQSTMIVTLEEVINNFPAIEADFNSYGGYIDLLGCGSERIALDQDITFLQKMIENGKRNGLILLGVTKGLEPFGDNNSINLSGASRVALYRMLQSEYSHVTSRHVDLDSTTSDKQLAVFIKNEFLSESKEAEICYRDNMRYTAIMKEVKENKPIKQTFQFPKEHVLWVTGGTKGIGMLLAQHFVAKYGVKHLVLMGREELPPKEEWRSYEEEDSTLAHKIKNIRNLENMGATVKVLTVPLLDEQALKGAIEQVKTEMGPIGGVIHSAGMVNMQNPAFIRKSLESINQVLEPKVKGLEILYSCLSDEPLKFFVLLSSVAAAIPSLGSGQSDYAMANAFMDYFAHLHHSENHIVSIQWPNWKESGMGEIKGTAYRNTGILSLTNNEGLSLLDQILVGHYGPVILPTVVNTDLWDPQMVMKKSLTDNKATKKAAISLFEESNELLTQTKNWLLGLFSNELKIEEYKIQSQISFEEYGVDSVLMAQILQQINNILDENVDPSLLFEYQTIDSLAKYLYQKYNNTLAKRFNFTVNNSIDSTHSLTNQKSPISINHIEERATSSGSLSDSPKGSILQNIAVIGISCQFPGANTLEEYWGLLKSGKSALGKVPFQRWGYESNFYAGLLDNISKFDPQFFKMSEEDVRLMDPQALLLLKECLKLIYHAGYTEKEFGGTNTGVYIGGRSAHQIDEHHLMHAQNPILAVAQNFLATNISKYFDLKGPSLVVDTACSSSLVAMQIASQALVHKEISSAIVGGVSLLTTDAPHKIFESRKILSENPEYHVFDKRAQGVVLGEGIGLVLLKTVEQALKDGDKIFAVIKSIAVNNDGRTVTSTAPNFQAHKEVMVAGIDKSGREVAEISYLETNGSGTQLTDLLELKAIQSVYRESKKGPLFIGSIKPNIGHPLCAEGIASFIKVAMMIHHKQLVPFMSGYEQMDYFDMNNSPLFFNRKLMDWENHHKIAAINCFADGGTNVHVIMENWDDALDSERMVRSSINPPVLDEKDYSRTTEASTINSGMNDTKLKNTNIWDMF